MDTWRPITEEEMRKELDEQLAACQPDERETFSRIQIPLRPIPIIRYGKLEAVFAVAEKDGYFLVFEDIEEGFEWCKPDQDGVIRKYYCNQLELCHVMARLLDSGA